jgi:hypothetical protein
MDTKSRSFTLMPLAFIKTIHEITYDCKIWKSGSVWHLKDDHGAVIGTPPTSRMLRLRITRPNCDVIVT